jgi:hypothetical protein
MVEYPETAEVIYFHKQPLYKDQGSIPSNVKENLPTVKGQNIKIWCKGQIPSRSEIITRSSRTRNATKYCLRATALYGRKNSLMIIAPII